MVTVHPDFGKLAARIAITALYKDVEKDFSVVAKKLYDYINPKTGEKISVPPKALPFWKTGIELKQRVDSAFENR